MKITNEDNMELMARYEDNYFDLAIVDPPYGLGKRTTDGGSKKNTQTKFMDDIRRSNWDDVIPTDNYFEELFRVSKNQIIWGGNYFPYIWKNGCRGLITWDKMVYIPTMSQIEYAWFSEDKLPKLVKINNNDSNRLHPTQKPVKLYEWLLMNYAKPNDKILDTHLGSGSIAIACHNLGFDLTACELDKEYYDAAIKRLQQHQAQTRLF
jgi:site-specific DNA-methyltransferase (adenine-specific)